MKIFDNTNIIIKKSVALLLIGILFLYTIEALENPKRGPGQKPQPTNPLLTNSNSSNSISSNMTQGIAEPSLKSGFTFT